MDESGFGCAHGCGFVHVANLCAYVVVVLKREEADNSRVSQ